MSTPTSTPASDSTISSPTTQPAPKKQHILVPYSTEFDRVRQFLYGTKYRLVFTYRNTTRHKLVRGLRSASDPRQHGGVYHVPCKVDTCDLNYYGRTSRPFEIRLGEHMKAVEDGDTNSSLVKHMHSHPGHEFDFSSAKLLWKSKNVLESKIVESSCIQNFPSCNTQPGEVTVNPILASVITRMSNIRKFIRGPRTIQLPPGSPHPTLTPASSPLLPTPPTPIPIPPSLTPNSPSLSQSHSIAPTPISTPDRRSQTRLNCSLPIRLSNIPVYSPVAHRTRERKKQRNSTINFELR